MSDQRPWQTGWQQLDDRPRRRWTLPWLLQNGLALALYLVLVFIFIQVIVQALGWWSVLVFVLMLGWLQLCLYWTRRAKGEKP